jgi:O-antigen/teichoic acid export membrane protein
MPPAESAAGGRPRAWLAALRADGFVRRLTWLSGSVAVGQAFLLLCTPVLTRIYTPEDFGRFATVYAFVVLAGAWGLSGYPNDLALCRRRDVTPSVAAQLLLFVAFAGGLVVVGLVLEEALVAATGLSATLLWLTGAAALLQLALLPQVFLLVRHNDFRRYGRQRLVRLVGQGAGQILTGLTTGGVAGLLLGLMIGQLAGLATGFRWLLRELRRLRPRHLREGLRYMRREWRYAAFVMPAGLLTEAGQALPPLLAAISFGSQAAGMLLLAGRLLGMPIRLLSQAASQVLLADLGNADVATSRLLILRVLGFASVGGMTIVGVCLMVGDAVWTLVLGREWQGFAAVVRLLAVHYGLLFVFDSVRSVFLRDGKLVLMFNSAVPVLGAVLAFGVLPGHGIGFHTAILIHVVLAAGVTAGTLVRLLIGWSRPHRSLR